MTPRAQKSFRIILVTLAAILISALALAQTTHHPRRNHPPDLTAVYNFTHPK